MIVGSRAQVWHGKAKKTAYGNKGLMKGDLFKNKRGKIVSRKASRKAKQKGTLSKWMKSEGLVVKKGTFGLQKKGSKKKSSKKKSAKKKKSRSRSPKGKGTRRRRRKHKKGHRCRHAAGSKKGKFRKCYGYNH